jgi:hypothetical protein
LFRPDPVAGRTKFDIHSILVFSLKSMAVAHATTRGRNAVAWGLATFALLQISLTLAADCWFPGLRYPEYGRKLALLTKLQAEYGSQPDLVALGTSRTAFGFCPAADTLRPDRGQSWQFNFGLTGQGPIQELLTLQRLLAAGVRPRRLLIELHPPLLHQAGSYFEPGLGDLGRMNWADLSFIARYLPEPRQPIVDWFWSRLAPFYTHRRHLLGGVAPWLLTDLQRTDLSLTRETDRFGWSKFPVRPTDDANRRIMERWAVGLYVEYFRNFEVSDAPRRAIGEMLAICRREGIEPALVLMPECELFRQGYPATAASLLERWLHEMSEQEGIAIFDCRGWCVDEQFCDGHHMVPEGAERFSSRFEKRALRPWLAQRGHPRAEVGDKSVSDRVFSR